MKIPAQRRRSRLALLALGEALLKFYTEDSLVLSASIAYYSVLSMFPFLLLLLGLGGLYIRHYQLAGRLAVVLGPVLPMNPDFILENLQVISRAYGRVGFASFLLLLWSSAGVFLPIEKSLNRAWEIQEQRSWLGRRLLALEMSLIFAGAVLVSSSFVGVNLYVRQWMQSLESPEAKVLLGFGYHVLMATGNFLLTLGVFVVLFQRLPSRPIQFRRVLPSAFLTAVLWHAARSVFTLMLVHFNYRHVYGSIGAVVALMTWAYVSSAVMLFGARASGVLYRTLTAPEFERAAAPGP